MKYLILKKKTADFKSGKNAGKQYWWYTVQDEDGNKQDLPDWNYERGTGVTEGFTYEIKLSKETEGYVTAMKGVESTSMLNTESTVTLGPKIYSPPPRDDRTRQINKAQCLNVAATLHSNPEIHKAQGDEILARFTLELAEEIYKQAKQRKYFETL